MGTGGTGCGATREDGPVARGLRSREVGGHAPVGQARHDVRQNTGIGYVFPFLLSVVLFI